MKLQILCSKRQNKDKMISQFILWNYRNGYVVYFPSVAHKTTLVTIYL